MYEKGWSKKLSYVFAAAKDHLVDVVRYDFYCQCIRACVIFKRCG